MATTREFEFWDFVACAVCQLAFSPQIPFWITECGHVLCNAHLNPDQSCAKCGEQPIQLVTLQRDIDPPMADWFRSLPHAIDGIANAVKFQQESLAALVHHYRLQCMQLAATCDRLRNERRSLKRELHLSRTRGDPSGEPSAHPNNNGKRPMVETQGSVRTNSSPRSIPTPVGPLRLTIPPGEHPTFTRQEHPNTQFANALDRPGSSRFAQQYAYHGGDKPTDEHPPASARSLDTSHRIMAPPPPPSHGKRFNPTTGQAQRTSDGMGPPPTLQRPFSAALRLPTQNAPAPPSLPTNRFVPGSASHSRGAVPMTVTTTSGNRMPFMPRRSNGFG